MLDTYPDITITNLDKLTYAGSLSNIPDLINNKHHQFIKEDICDKNLIFYQYFQEKNVAVI